MSNNATSGLSSVRRQLSHVACSVHVASRVACAIRRSDACCVQFTGAATPHQRLTTTQHHTTASPPCLSYSIRPSPPPPFRPSAPPFTPGASSSAGEWWTHYSSVYINALKWSKKQAHSSFTTDLLVTMLGLATLTGSGAPPANACTLLLLPQPADAPPRLSRPAHCT